MIHGHMQLLVYKSVHDSMNHLNIVYYNPKPKIKKSLVHRNKGYSFSIINDQISKWNSDDLFFEINFLYNLHQGAKPNTEKSTQGCELQK